MRVVLREAAVDRLAVDGEHVASEGDGVLRRGDDGAVDGDAAGEDERLGRAAGRDAESRERLGEAHALGVLGLALLEGERVLARESLLGLARAHAFRGRGGTERGASGRKPPPPPPRSEEGLARATTAEWTSRRVWEDHQSQGRARSRGRRSRGDGRVPPGSSISRRVEAQPRVARRRRRRGRPRR